jgi:iron(III) transport system substrate-binding protein
LPGIRLDYQKMNSGDIYDQIVANESSADLVWSSAIDLQFKLVNDGYARTHRSPESPALPDWACWQDQAYGTTIEPIVMIYNKARLPVGLVPTSHLDLVRILNGNVNTLLGRVGTYDAESSGTGFLFLTQDAEVTPKTWDIVHALGRVGAKLYLNSDTMIDHVVSGELMLAYNVIGSYAIERALREPKLGIVHPADYTLAVSRIALIPRRAPNPTGGQAFLDYVLSRAGQSLLASRSVAPVRDDANVPETTQLTQTVRATLRPIHPGPDLLIYLDDAKRKKFLKQWRQALNTF